VQTLIPAEHAPSGNSRGHREPGAWTSRATRTDALYFTVTVFSTVGFGDISATSQAARLIVTIQMILDLIVLGLGVRVFLAAVEFGRVQQAAQQEPAS
jgi:hypothetical protein